MNDVIAEILAYLQAELGVRMKTYYLGEVEVTPKSYLPALMIIPNETNLIAKTTAEDQEEFDITIRVVTDLKTYLNEAGTGTTIKQTLDHVNIMEERNSNMTLKSNTVLGALRKYITGSKYLFNNNARITYQVIQTGEWFYCRSEINLKAVTNLHQRNS